MYCNTIELYCEKRARQGWTALQYSAQPSHDTATVAATRHAGVGLGTQEGAGGRWACGWALGVRRALGWASRQAHGSRRGAQVGRRWGAQASTWADARALGEQAAGSRRGRHGRKGVGRVGQAAGAAWVRGLALGCALDLFLARFDSVFS